MITTALVSAALPWRPRKIVTLLVFTAGPYAAARAFETASGLARTPERVAALLARSDSIHVRMCTLNRTDTAEVTHCLPLLCCAWQLATTVCMQVTFGTSLQIAISTAYRHEPTRPTKLRAVDTVLFASSLALVPLPPPQPLQPYPMRSCLLYRPGSAPPSWCLGARTAVSVGTRCFPS